MLSASLARRLMATIADAIGITFSLMRFPQPFDAPPAARCSAAILSRPSFELRRLLIFADKSVGF